MILSLHQLEDDKQQIFEQVPKYLFLKVSLPDETRVEGYFRMDFLSPALRKQVWAEVFGKKEAEDLGSSPAAAKKAPPERVFVGANPEDVYVPPVVVDTYHNTLDQWLTAIKVARDLGGDICKFDLPRELCFGFVHHPADESLPSAAHFLRIRVVKASYASPAVAESLGMTPEDIREKFRTDAGREEIILGGAPPQFADPAKDALLQDAMLKDPISAYLRDGGGVEFPEVSLWGFPNFADYSAEEELKRQKEIQESRALRNLRPKWVPEGWARFVLPADKDRFGPLRDDYKVVPAGAFIRRNDVIFRIFDDGMWDKCQAGTFLSRKKAGSPEEALREVLPLLEKEGPGPIMLALARKAGAVS